MLGTVYGVSPTYAHMFLPIVFLGVRWVLILRSLCFQGMVFRLLPHHTHICIVLSQGPEWVMKDK